MTYTVYWSGAKERSGECPSLLSPRSGGSSLSMDRIVTHGDSDQIEWSPKARLEQRRRMRQQWHRQRRRTT